MIRTDICIAHLSFGFGARCPPALRNLILIFSAGAFLAPIQSYAAEMERLLNLSIEELGNIRVTSVSKKEESLAKAPAAIYVITHDAIHRSGVQSLPEALRLAPHLLVAKIDSYRYAISARGFNGSTSNKLLVLIDGRTVYTPLYSGVFWDAQDVLLDDVDRIEVINGAGGTLWGANAVNGVINIITRHADETNGNLIHAVGGNVSRGIAARHGGALGDINGSYRVYVKLNKWGASVRENGAAVPDEWSSGQTGFRTDWHSGQDDFTVQGDAYRNSIDQAAPGEQENTGANVLGRWNRSFAGGSSLRMQAYIDHGTRDTPGVYSERINSLDVDIQHSLPEQAGNQLIWGGGYRGADDHVGNTAVLAFLPAHRKLHWANLFAQQQSTLWSDWKLTVGGKLETNDYTGVEFLPNLVLAWSPAGDKLLWIKASRSVRAPSRIETEFYIAGAPPYYFVGNPDFRSEVAKTLEAGWRAQFGQALSYSVVAFHSEYERLRGVEVLPSGAFFTGNDVEGHSDGLEASFSYQVAQSWAVDASALVLHQHFESVKSISSSQGEDPRSQWKLGSRWNFDNNKQLDISFRHVGALPAPMPVPAYSAIDMHFGWAVSGDIELAVSGRNLGDKYHQEFGTGTGVRGLNPIQVERELDVGVTVNF